MIIGLQKWEYLHVPEEGTPEHELLEVLRNPKDWINYIHSENKNC